jgi:predicted RNase H-like nuclease
VSLDEPFTVAGVDGCPGGLWVVVTARYQSTTEPDLVALEVGVVADLAPLVDTLRAGALQAIAIDMPIGLLADRPRASDREARRLLGPRRASVFPTPSRAVLRAGDYAEACALSRAACGKAISKQTFHLLDRIRHLDELVEPSDQDRLVEAHPEMAFTRLNTGFVTSTKHTAEGRRFRRDLLHRELAPSLVDAVVESRVAPVADLLDACVLVTTARRVTTGDAVRVGSDIDPTGKRADIAY